MSITTEGIISCGNGETTAWALAGLTGCVNRLSFAEIKFEKCECIEIWKTGLENRWWEVFFQTAYFEQ